MNHHGLSRLLQAAHRRGIPLTIHDSVVRIMSSQQVFGDAFYEVFFQRCPEVKPFFSASKMERQALLLTMAVSLIEEYYSHGYPATEKYIKYLGTQHQDRAIPRELYPKWRDAMIETLQRFFGDEWTAELATEWTNAIDRTAQVMFEGYAQRFAV